VGPRAILNAVVKRKIPSPHQESTLEPRLSSLQPSTILTELSWLYYKALYKPETSQQTMLVETEEAVTNCGVKI